MIEEEKKRWRGRGGGGEGLGVKELADGLNNHKFFGEEWNDGVFMGGGFWGYMSGGGRDEDSWEKLDDAVFLGLQRAERWDLVLSLSLKQKKTKFMADALIKMDRYEVNLVSLLM